MKLISIIYKVLYDMGFKVVFPYYSNYVVFSIVTFLFLYSIFSVVGLLGTISRYGKYRALFEENKDKGFFYMDPSCEERFEPFSSFNGSLYRGEAYPEPGSKPSDLILMIISDESKRRLLDSCDTNSESE